MITTNNVTLYGQKIDLRKDHANLYQDKLFHNLKPLLHNSTNTVVHSTSVLVTQKEFSKKFQKIFQQG